MLEKYLKILRKFVLKYFENNLINNGRDYLNFKEIKKFLKTVEKITKTSSNLRILFKNMSELLQSSKCIEFF